MRSLVLCALATTTAAAAPARDEKTSGAERAGGSDDDTAEARPARKAKARKAKVRKAKVRDERDVRATSSRGARNARSTDDGATASAPDRRDTAARETAARETQPREEVDVVVVKAAKPRPQPRRHRNELYIVAGVAHVDARVASGGLQLDPTGLASIAAMPGPVGGSVVSDPSNLIAGMIGFAPAALRGHVAFETVIGIPKTTQLRATGDLATKSLAPTALGIIPTGIPPLGEQLGEAKAFPPMVTALFRLPALGPARFYVGGGASVLFITGARITNPVLTEVATPRLDVTPAMGLVGQIGVDVQISRRFSARIDVKEMWFQSSEATISNIRVHTTIPLLETVDVGSAKSELRANPIIVQAGVKASF
jgi:outer membrane protein W